MNPGGWHDSPCVPFNSGLATRDVVAEDRYERYVEKSYPVIDVGGTCLPDTGCYTCGNRRIGEFRADAFTLMRQDFSNSYGAYQNAQLVDIIDKILADNYDDGFWEYHAGYIEPE